MSMEGMKAEGFSLTGSDGQLHTLEKYAGKTMIIYFYPRDNTPGCTKEACGFRDTYKELADRNIILLGVSKDNQISHNKFIAAFHLPFVLLSDPDATMMKAYGAYGEKTACGRTSMGTIRSTVIIGPDGIVKKHWPKVAKAEQHPVDVLDYLKKHEL